MSNLPKPKGDILIFESAKGDCEIGFAARPSGTEPKIKFYFFARTSPPAPEALSDTKAQTETKLREFQTALTTWVHQVWESGSSPAT
jgi:phosphoglucomutase/phosphomannomutase